MIPGCIAAVSFAAAACLGALLGLEFCKGKVPFADGPSPVGVRLWPIVLAGALVGAGLVLHGAAPLQLATAALVVVALAACTVSDFQLGVVPDLFTLVPLAALLLSSAFEKNFAPSFSAAIMALPFAVAALMSRGLGMGWGDVKLVALGGAVLGARDATLALIIACVAALAYSRISGLRGRPLAFGPYVATGIGAMLVFGASL